MLALMLFILKTHLCPSLLYLQSTHSFTSTLVMPIPDERFSPMQSAVLVLPVTTVIQKDTSRTTAGNSIPKSEVKTEEAL
jgi:hypothetical protein